MVLHKLWPTSSRKTHCTHFFSDETTRICQVREEGDPGRGGLQGTRPRAGQLGRPAPRGLSVCTGGGSPQPLTTPTLSPSFHYIYYLICLASAFPGWRVGPLLACSPPNFLGAWG
eukprot:894285-Prorocentrum_minimum.AAC.1